jgi:hypothetical protein
MSVANDFGLPEDDEPAATPDTTPQPGKGLRARYEEAIATNKALTDRVSAMESERRTSRLAELAKAAGLPDTAATRYPADAEVTPEKFNPWAEQEKAYAQQLLGSAAAPAEQPAQPGTPPPPQGVTAADQLAAARVQAQADGSQPAVEGLDHMLARLQDKSTDWPTLKAELDALGFRDA